MVRDALHHLWNIYWTLSNKWLLEAGREILKTTTNNLRIFISNQLWVTCKAWKDRDKEKTKRRPVWWSGFVHILHLDCFNSVTRQHYHHFATILIKVKTTVPSLECNFGSCLKLESFTSLHCVPSLWVLSN